MNSTGFFGLYDGSGNILFSIQNGRFLFGVTDLGPIAAGAPMFVSTIGQNNPALWVDGVLLYSDTVMFPTPLTGNFEIVVGGALYGASSFRISRLALSGITRIKGEHILTSTSGQRFSLLADTLPSVNVGTPPAALSSATLGPNQSDGSALDAFNELILAEQGEFYPVTTGTLTAPTQTLTIRERTRPATITTSFDVVDELDGAPSFVRDITNLISRINVQSDAGDTLVIDDTLTTRAGQAGDSETVLLVKDIDRRMWGQDRLQRGANTKMQIASVVVDAMTTPTDRSADLLALVPGDRVEFTGLPSTVLGFDTWEGWFLGASETHTIDEHSFELHFAPVLPDTAIYDTDRHMASGELQLNGGINSAVTSISVESTGALLSTTATPYTIQFDDEQMTVTAVAGASSPQTVTVTRGVNGTTAASHLDNAVLVSVPDSLYAF
jgi:hypothetical protein